MKIGLLADSSGLTAGLKQGATALSNFQNAVNSAKGVLAGFGVAMGLSAAVDGFQSMIGAASDLQENVSRTRAIFGEGAASVIADSNEMAKAFGTAKNEYLDAAGKFGSLFKGAGFGADEVARLSMQFVRLSGDVSSFDTIDFVDAMHKLRSGLSGEAEPLRDIGVFMDEASTKAYAYSHGIARVGEELTNQQKILARVGQLMEATKDKQGDLARTKGGQENLVKNLQGSLQNAGAAIGTVFLPAMEKALSVTTEFVKSFMSFAESSGLLSYVGTILDLAIVQPLGFLQTVVYGVRDAFAEWGITVDVVKQKIEQLIASSGPIGWAINWANKRGEESRAAAAAMAKVPKFEQVAQQATPFKATEGMQFPAAQEFGSKEAYSSILRSRSAFTASDSQRQLAAHAKTTADNSAKTVDALKRIHDALMRQGSALHTI